MGLTLPSETVLYSIRRDATSTCAKYTNLPQFQQLRYNGENLSSVDGLAFFREQAFYGPVLGRANLVLHFHRFDDHEPLTGLHPFARLDEDTNHFPRHRCGNLLLPFGFHGAMPSPAPSTRIENLSSELLVRRLQTESAFR